MHEKNIVTKEDLDDFAKNNSDELSKLKGIRENLWKRYHRAKTEDKQKEIIKRVEVIQNNLNNFDKDIKKEKENSRNL